MRKIFWAFALTPFLCGCTAQNKETGGENETPAEDSTQAFLKKKTLGFYGFDNSDYLYSKGQTQISRRYSKDGRNVEFCLLDTENGTVYSLDGITTSAQKGDGFLATFTVTKAQTKVKEVASVTTVLAVSSDTLWLRNSRDVCFIVKK